MGALCVARTPEEFSGRRECQFQGRSERGLKQISILASLILSDVISDGASGASN